MRKTMSLRRYRHALVVLGVSLLAFSCDGSQEPPTHQELLAAQQKEESNKAIVNRYFFEFLDARGDMGLLNELFTEDCIVQRAELPGAIQGLTALRAFMDKTRATMPELHTSVQTLVAEGDTVFVYIRHRAVFDGTFSTAFGTKEIHNLPVEWAAMSVFRLVNGKIAEQQVLRDELGILMQQGFIQKP
jgi:predicted ester cyclase